MRRTLYLLLCLASSICFCTISAASKAADPVILVIGDSLSAAYNMSEESGWVALLQQRLRHHALPHAIVNASISGDTTYGGVNRIETALARNTPAVTIIELGANDGLRGLSLDKMRDNLGRMIELALARQSKVLLLGVQLPPNYGPNYTEHFQQSYALVAERYDVALVPSILAGFEDNSHYFQHDQIHPSAEAQALILDNVWPALKPLLD